MEKLGKSMEPVRNFLENLWTFGKIYGKSMEKLGKSMEPVRNFLENLWDIWENLWNTYGTSRQI